MSFRVGRQHPLYFADQPRVPAARLFDKAHTISRWVIQGGFEDFANALINLRLDKAARLTHSFPLWLQLRRRAKAPPIIAEAGGPGSPLRAGHTQRRMTDSKQITAWLALWRNGDKRAREKLFEIVHIQLRQIAANLLQRERANHTLQPSALVNELCVRLLGGAMISYQDRAHFFAIAAQTMRRSPNGHEQAGIAG